jgi:hypothetical protein
VKNTARNTLLVTVAAAALMAGTGLVSAQDTKEKGQAPAAAATDKHVPPGKMGSPPAAMPQKSPAPTAQAPMTEKPAATAQAPTAAKPEAAAPGRAAQTSEPSEPRTAPTAAKSEPKTEAPTALSSEQHTKIRDTLRGGKAEHLTKVPFATTVGGVIPGSVHLYVLPVSIAEYAPEYRDYEYILVDDEILIVDPHTLKIVAVIAA